MRDWKYRHHLTRERENTSRTNNAVESFHAGLRRRIQVVHPNLFTFLGHQQRTTADSDAEVGRLSRGMLIRRAKKRVNLTNDARIKACLQRFDNGGYTRIQFLRGVSHSLGARVPCDVMNQSDYPTTPTTPTTFQPPAVTVTVRLQQPYSRPTSVKSAWLRSAMHAMHSSLAVINVSVRRVRARVEAEARGYPCSLVPIIPVSHFQSPQ